jgi:NADH-quinone oxidoreductase subunit M
MNKMTVAIILLPFISAFINLKIDLPQARRQFIEWVVWIISALLLICIFNIKSDHQIVIESGSPFLLAFIYSFCFLSIKILSSPTLSSPKENTFELMGYGGVLGLLLTDQLFFIVPFWICHLLPSWHEMKSTTSRFGLFQYFQAMGVLFLIAGLVLISRYYTSFSELQLAPHEHMPLDLTIGGFLILFASLIRQGIFPFHWWIRDFTRRTSSIISLQFLVSFSGLILIQKIALPILHEDFKELFPLLSFITIFSSLYLALINTIENEIKIVFHYLVFSQSGLVAGGFELQETISNYGSIYQWIALMMTATGLGLALHMLIERTGLIHLKRCYGFSEKAPRLGGFTVVLTMALVGLPGAMAFIGEDLLFHEIIEHYPIVGLGVIITGAINGLVGYRQYIYLFNGELDTNLICPEIQKKEARVLGCIVFFLFILGIIPTLILH